MKEVTLSAYQAAEREAALEEGRRGFFVHAVITAAVVVGLIVVNVTVASEFPWSIFPTVGMGIGLFAHWYFGVRRADDVIREEQTRLEHRAAA